jgi:lysophospholipase L1-like esterase
MLRAMKIKCRRIPSFVVSLIVLLSLSLIHGGCEDGDGGGGGGGGGASNNDPGDNDINLYVVVGDSIPQGNGEPFAAWPERLGPLIGKTVVNLAVDGDTAASGAQRVGGILTSERPGYLLNQYGVTDVIQGNSAQGAVAIVRGIVQQAKDNHTLPVVCNYPAMIGPHAIFAAAGNDLNQKLRYMADQEGVPVIDIAAAFGADTSLYMPDGLHPNDAGTARMANTAADVLR